MSSPASCYSPTSQSSYCPSVFSYNGSGYPHSPGDMSNITSPDSATPKESFSPLMFASPSPTMSSLAPPESLSGLPPLSPPSNTYGATGYSGSVGCSPSSSHISLSPYPQEFYRPQPLPVLPQLDTNIHHSSYVTSQQQYTYSPQSTSPTSSTTSASPYARNRRSLPPIDPTRFEEEEWFTPSGKKVRHSAMHYYCATM